MTQPVAFTKRSAPISFDKGLGLCFGWFCFSKKDGEDYVDSHGDHFPDDELLKAVDALMAKAATEREINVDHAGGARGVICTAYALTEDIAKGHGWETGGNYGVVGSFRPDAELMKSIQAGDMFCLSIEGKSYDVEEVAKSGEGAAATARKRTMRKVELTKLAVVKLGAHEGAAVAVVKSATDAARRVVAVKIAKRTPALTDVVDGHQHVIDDVGDPDIKHGCTSYASSGTSSSGYGGHSHDWIRSAGGSIEIAAAHGHTHSLATELEKTAMSNAPDFAKQLADAHAALAKTQSLVLVACGLPAAQIAYVQQLTPADVETFLAKSDSDRAALATPVYTATDGTAYYASHSPATVNLAKKLDAQGVELAKARESGEVAGFAKTASEKLKHLVGGQAVALSIVKALHGKAITDAERDAALTALAANDAAVAMVTKAVGYGGAADPADPASPQAELDAIAADIAKAKGVSIAKAADLALDTPRGAQLYKQIEGARRAPATA